MKTKSKILTDYQLAKLEIYEQGNKADKTGVISKRIKPVLKEILEVWIPQKKRIIQLLEKKLNK